MEDLGRMVFPVFALVWGLACGRRAVRARSVIGLAALAAVAELACQGLVWAGVRAPLPLNVLATLALGACAVECLRWMRAGRHWDGVVGLSAVACAGMFVEYGLVGVAMVVAASTGRWAWIVAGVAALSVYQLTVWPLAAVPLVWAVDAVCGDRRWRAPRRVFAWAYVGQFAVLGAVAVAVAGGA